jgi:hypothetical protein
MRQTSSWKTKLFSRRPNYLFPRNEPFAILIGMKLLFLHGAPAVGKLTVAKALLRIVPGRLMDNHAAIDLARTIFEFGAPGFWELVHDVRYSALDAAAANGVSLLVTTFCYVEPEDREQFGKFEAISSGMAASCFRSSCTVRAKKPCAGSVIPTGSSGAR